MKELRRNWWKKLTYKEKFIRSVVKFEKGVISENKKDLKTIPTTAKPVIKLILKNNFFILKAIKKQVPLKVDLLMDSSQTIVEICPVCKHKVFKENDYCGHCGQRIIFR